jgi:hypothetical protein
MGDYGWARIFIGGTLGVLDDAKGAVALTPDQRQGLQDALSQEGVELDLTVGVALQRADGQLDIQLDEDGHLMVTDEYARNAIFEALEERLIELGIPFDRQSGHAGEFGDMLAYWRPGMTTKVDELSDSSNSTLYVPLDQVREHLRAGDLPAWLDATYPEPAPLPPLVLP